MNDPAAGLSPDTLLQLSPDLRMRLGAGGHVLVDSPTGTVVDTGPRGFAALELFRRPVALGEAIAHLESGGHPSTDVAPTLGVITMLLEEGALVRPGAEGSPASGWADPIEHARMLHDDRRTCDYLRAIAQAVRPGDVVVEIGTGSGVLAVAAARAGARRVYAVEASDIAQVAERVFAVNGVQDRVTLIPGWSRQIDLPEPADLLISEIIGCEPLEEEILETTLDARRRLLTPDARLIPHRLTLLARPLIIPEVEARQRSIAASAVDRWAGLYGMDLRPLLDAASPGPVHFPTEGETAAGWAQVGPPAELTSIDLCSFETASVDASADLVVDGAASANAVAVTFRADLHGNVTHTLDPWRWPASSWGTSVWVLPDPLPVARDAVLRVHYRRRAAGTADGLTCEVVDAVG